MAEERKSELRKLAEFVHGLTWEKLPGEVQLAVQDRVLDLVSVAAGACEDGLVRRIAASCSARGESCPCHVWGYEDTFSLSAAAMLNGLGLRGISGQLRESVSDRSGGGL